MIYFYILLFIVSILAGFCEGVADILNFKFYDSIFSKKNHKFWNKDISYVNKNVEGSWFKKKFYKTFWVFTTDGWHLFKSLHSFFLFSMVMIVYYCKPNNIIWFTIILLSSYLLKKLVFEISYKLLSLK